MRARRKLLAAVLAGMMVISTPLTAFAGTHTVSSYAEMMAKYGADTDELVTITLAGDIVFAEFLESKEGQKIVINGTTYKVQDVKISGAGEVEINSDVEGDDGDSAVTVAGAAKVTITGKISTTEGQESDGVTAYDDADVTVNGDIDVTYTGVDANDNANITVNGNITADEDGVQTYDDSKVTVNGDITSGDIGVNTSGASEATVNGDVNSGEDTTGVRASSESKVTVTGDVNSESTGVRAYEDATVTVDGNVTADQGGVGVQTSGKSQVTVSGNVTAGDEGAGIEASNESQVTVGGDVTGGNGLKETVDMSRPGSYSDGGTGVYAENSAQVTVDGNVSGGTGYGTYAYGGDGVVAEGNAQVTVGGNATGGNVEADPDTVANDGDYSEGGTGVMMSSTNTVTVGGDVTGGDTNAEHGNGGNGVIIYLVLESDENVPGAVAVGGTVSNGTGGVNGTDSAALGIYIAQQQLAALTAAKDLPEDLTEKLSGYVIPEITIWAISTKGNGTEVAEISDTKVLTEDEVAAFQASVVNFEIKVEQPVGGTVSVDKATAVAGDTITIDPKAKDGYELSKVLVSGTEIKAVDGKYQYVVPEEGGVLVTAEFTEIKKEVVEPNETKDPEIVKTNTPATTTTTTTTASAKTNDPTTVAPFILMICVAMGSVVVVLKRRKTV